MEKNEVMNPLELAQTIVRILDDKKAFSLKLLHVEKQTVLTDYFVICSGTSNTQIKSLCGEVEHKLSEKGVAPMGIEGYNEASWIVLDYGSVIVHIFNRETRNYYNLEKLWADSTDVDIKQLLDTENEDK